MTHIPSLRLFSADSETNMNFSTSENDLKTRLDKFLLCSAGTVLPAVKARKQGLYLFFLREVLDVDSEPLWMDLKAGVGSATAGSSCVRKTRFIPRIKRISN